jgi:hypothetical protein
VLLPPLTTRCAVRKEDAGEPTKKKKFNPLDAAKDVIKNRLR